MINMTICSKFARSKFLYIMLVASTAYSAYCTVGSVACDV